MAGWLTVADSTNLIIPQTEFFWEFSDFGWSFKGRRWTYYVRRQQKIVTREWVAMEQANADSKAASELSVAPTQQSDETLRTVSVRQNDAGAYKAMAVKHEVLSDWVVYAIEVKGTGDV